jgi:mannosyl-oligosaccharide alpha-1,2-mannosidase
VKNAFERSWKSYEALAWSADELAPLSGSHTNGLGGWGATLVENLDTLWIMGMHDDFEKAVAAVASTDFQNTASPDINTHEVNTRLLGGLLAAYDLSGDFRLQKKAIELGDMLYAAFDTPNRMPVIHWDPHRAARQEEQLAEEGVLAAELGSFTLEFIRLSQITGDPKYFDAAQRVMEVFERQQDSTKLAGLWPVSVNPRTELFDGDMFTLGAEANALYKSLPRAYALLGGNVPMYRKMYEKATLTAAGHNLFRPMNPEEKDMLTAGIIRVFMTQNGKPRTHLESQVQYRSCFAGGMFALGGVLFQIPIHKKIAHKLVDGCIWAHEALPLGIMPEVYDTVPCASQTNCPWNEWHWKQEVWKRAHSLQLEPDPDLNVDAFINDHHLPRGFINIPNTAYNLRPEAIESIFTLYRVTGREDLLDTAWEMFRAIQSSTQVENGNSAIIDVTIGTEPIRVDSMPSYWMSQTLKYFYLMFSPPDLISLDDYVFSAGGHPLKRPKASWS